MKKLLALRQAILGAPLKIKAEQLLTWAEKGQVQSWRGAGNNAFQVTYTIRATVTDYTGAPQDLLFVAVDWLHQNNPDAATDAIGFHVDVIDTKKVDVELTIEVSEVIAGKDTPKGLALAPAPDPDVNTFDMGTFFADLNKSG